jgi:Photosynthesis affected mutant 68
MHIDLPVYVVYVVQTIFFGGGLLGITYGILSSSWEEGREGSAWGLTELKANLPILMKALREKKNR